jgi:hypothetical protein
MLLIADQSVVLLSSNPTLLTKLQLALPYLVYPFDISGTHLCVQLSNAVALECFMNETSVKSSSVNVHRSDRVDQQPGAAVDIGDAVDEPQSSFKSMLTRFSSFRSVDTAKLASPGMAASSSFFTNIGSGLRRGSGTATAKHRESWSSNLSASAAARSWIIGVDSKTYYGSHLKTKLSTGISFKGRCAVTIDIDLGLVVVSSTAVLLH